MKELWKKLNPRQLEAVQAVEGVIQIGAVAGSGKTTVLTHRVEHMIHDLGIDPKLIALMTFTAKAAENMKERLEKLITKAELSQMFCGTSHSFGYKVLSVEYKDMNHPLKDFTRNDKGNPGVLTGGWQRTLGEEAKKLVLKLDWEPEMRDRIEEIGIKSFLRFVSLAKNANKDQFQVEEELASEASPNQWAYIHFYKIYEDLKTAKRSIDFDDMLFLAVRLLVENPHILRKYQKMFKYIMTDEAQDNNILQYMLVSMIGAIDKNLFFVGDDDQSMYAFRGADPDSFIQLNRSYPDLVNIPLENNYRSFPDILNRANKLIANNTNRIVKQLVPHKEDESKAVFYSHFNKEMDEAEWIAKEIGAIINDQEADFTEEIQYKQIACLYRTNAQCKELEDSLITHGIPYVIHGGYSFYERKEVKDILSYLSLAVNSTDNNAFKRVYNVPTRYLGKAFLEKVSKGRDKSLFANLDKVELTYKEKDSAGNFKRMVNDIKARLIEEVPLDEVIDFIMDNGYRQYLIDRNDSDEEEDEAGENEIVEKLKYFVKRFENVKQLFEYVELMTGSKKDNVNGVQLMTIHRSKGLEFHAVFGVGFNENLLPHFRSIEAAETGEKPLAIEEERRLAYVLVTRGESRVYLSSTDSFNGKAQTPSRFLEEMELIQDVTPKSEEEPVEQPQKPEVKVERKVEPKPEVVVVSKPNPVPQVGLGVLDDIPEVTVVTFDKQAQPQQATPSVKAPKEPKPTPVYKSHADQPIVSSGIAAKYFGR